MLMARSQLNGQGWLGHDGQVRASGQEMPGGYSALACALPVPPRLPEAMQQPRQRSPKCLPCLLWGILKCSGSAGLLRLWPLLLNGGEVGSSR